MRSRYFLDIDPELRNRFKSQAALHGKTMREWLTDAIISKLEDEIDSFEGLKALSNDQGTKTLEEYLYSRESNKNTNV